MRSFVASQQRATFGSLVAACAGGDGHEAVPHRGANAGAA